MSARTTFFKKSLTTKPGTFRARCNLSEPTPVNGLPHHLRREYEEAGWKKGTRDIYDKKWRRDRPTECFLKPLCAGFETTDPAEFERHMLEQHGRKPSNWQPSRGVNEALSRRIDAGWRSPRLRDAGQPLVKDAAVLLLTCERCGLAAEVSTNASELWWREHVEHCVGQVVETDERAGAA